MNQRTFLSGTGMLIMYLFACFNGSKIQLDLFLKYIYNIHQNIKFTVQTEVDNKINYLDLKLKKKCRFEFSIYRKPTHTDTTIP